MVRPPLIFAPVHNDLLFLTADEQVFLQRGQGFIVFELSTPISLFCVWRKDLNDDRRVSQHSLYLLGTTDRHIWMQVVISCEFQLHIRRVDNTRTVLWQSLVKQRGKASGEGCVGGTPACHVNRDVLHIERRGWAQHENEAMPILIEAIGCVIKGERLLYGHINRSISKARFFSDPHRAYLSFLPLAPL